MIRLSRTVWIQLTVLATVTVTAVGVMAFGFVKVPELLGIGRYTVQVEMPAAGGLYPTSVVTYRGTEVGRVRTVEVTREGVRAILTLDSGIPVPGAVSAAVHSRSAIGEQFLELKPLPGAGTERRLRNGDVIPAAAVMIPPDIADLLDATNQALKAIPSDNLRTIVDGSSALAVEAGRSIGPITALIDQAPPVLESQVRTADSIASWARSMAAITGQLKNQDAALNSLLRQGAPALGEGKALFERLSPTLPLLLANMVSLGQIAVTYRADIEQLLVLFPQGTAVMSAIAAPNAGTNQNYRGIYLDFNLNLNLPPPCNTGFLPVSQQRVPSDVDAPERPAGELYCRIPQDSPLNVRGVRNIPCRTNPPKRAPTVEMCESGEQYVPLNEGWNWKGDPNATLSGQGVPQYPIAPTAAVPYDPATGRYVGPDGKPAEQTDLARPEVQSWQDVLMPQG
jgi:phospholipid/cholesterol/gamma-HCH transport system substrate-binding protein